MESGPSRSRSQEHFGWGKRCTPPRLVHKLVFSMPAGTNPESVLSAAQKFCREEFALKHRYVMALHTDEPHPHVHVVLKAVNEQGRRLNIKKATLQEWRAKFAAYLREQGVAANATPRRFRDQQVRSTPHAVLCQRARERQALERAVPKASAASPLGDLREAVILIK
ncbi:MAG: relaxase/mobilization nuclease domain-containing protein [Steroidobacteraceae bacterium]